MKGLCVGIITTAVLFAAACKASEPPTQVVYRFDDHRYLELKGWDCEGELWYTVCSRGTHIDRAVLSTSAEPAGSGFCAGIMSGVEVLSRGCAAGAEGLTPVIVAMGCRY